MGGARTRRHPADGLADPALAAGLWRGPTPLYQRVSLLTIRWLAERTRVGELPGCGHVPMADDPDAVAALITATARVWERSA